MRQNSCSFETVSIIKKTTLMDLLAVVSEIPSKSSDLVQWEIEVEINKQESPLRFFQ